jgi:hypothetical protein
MLASPKIFLFGVVLQRYIALPHALRRVVRQRGA